MTEGMNMKLMLAVTLMLVGSLAHAATDTTPGVEMRMLNKNPNPSIGDRIALQEVKGDQCRFYGKVVEATESNNLEVAINRKICADNLTRVVSLVVPLPTGSIQGNEIFIGYTTPAMKVVRYERIAPMVIETNVPHMSSDNATWRVKVTASYITAPGVSKKIEVMSFDIPSGECRSGAPKIVPMQGFEAQVTPKLCAGEVDGQSVILGWLVADKVDSEPMSSIDLASLNYGERMYFRFNGSELTAEASIYQVEAKKL